MAKYKIIFIDDEDDILDAYESEFLTYGFEIITFNNPNNALSYLEENHGKVVYVFSDYNMPEMNGIEFRRAMLAKNIALPISIVTAFYNLEMTVVGMELGISQYIKKPFSSPEIISTLQNKTAKRISEIEEDREMKCSFIDESYPMLEEIENLILNLENDPENVSILDTYFRLLHTIKGTSACVGIKNIPSFTHRYEDLINKVRARQLKINQAVIDVLLKGLDSLKIMYSEIKENLEISNDVSELVKIFDRDFSKTDLIEDHTKVPEKKQASTAESSENKMSVSLDVLDEFMDLNGELTVLRNAIIKSTLNLQLKYAGDKDIDVLGGRLVELQKVSSNIQNKISEMRKIELNSIYKPLHRVVRDASKNLNKKINFRVTGDDLKVDTVITRVLSGALVHMIRNSVDHGIELPQKRKDVGKDEFGTIELLSREDGENIVIELRDDGNGLNTDRIKQRAIANGLYTEEQIARMSMQKIFLLIFEPGFSTAEVVTDISGRGVGMDMVRTSIEGLGGKILIESEISKGSTFFLIIPIPRSVLILKSLTVKVKNNFYAIPLDEVMEVIRIENYFSSPLIHKISGGMLLSHQNELLPLLWLEEALKQSEGSRTVNTISIVLINSAAYRFGVVVDEILDIEEVVVKKMSEKLEELQYFMGATFAGDGDDDLALILDSKGIAVMSKIGLHDEEDSSRYLQKAIVKEGTEYMQFHLMNIKHCSVPLECVDRLEVFRSSDIEFSGDVPIIRYRELPLPLIFIERQLKLVTQEKTLVDFYPEIINAIIVKHGDKKIGLIVNQFSDIKISSDIIDKSTAGRDGIVGTLFLDSKIVTILDVPFITENHTGTGKVLKMNKNEIPSIKNKMVNSN